MSNFGVTWWRGQIGGRGSEFQALNRRMTRLVLTIAQARTLQRNPTPWPAEWAFMLIGEREKPDATADDARMAIGWTMMQRGCGDDQIAEQLSWKPDSTPLYRLHKSEWHSC